jgi:hypothetical protein
MCLHEDVYGKGITEPSIHVRVALPSGRTTNSSPSALGRYKVNQAWYECMNEIWFLVPGFGHRAVGMCCAAPALRVKHNLQMFGFGVFFPPGKIEFCKVANGK